MSAVRQRDRWLWAGLASIAFICLPLLFITPGADWYNHVWMVDYNARYFATHFSFPAVLNTYQIIGMASPIFYGYLFFPVLGSLSTVLSANWTLRVFSALILAAQYVLIYRTALRLSGDKFLSFAVGTLSTWSIYQLTNLYNRGAIPEFFACQLLTFSCVALIRACNSQKPKQIWLWSNFSILCFCGCAGTHPITALYGLLFYAILFGVAMVLTRRSEIAKQLLALVVPGVIAAVILSPWVLSTIRYNKQLAIANSFREVSYWAEIN